MKKFFLISMLFFSMKSFSQNAYHDAIAISKYLVNDSLSTDSASKAEYSKILNNYLIKPHNVFTPKTIFNDYTLPASPNFNPFLKNFFPLPVEGIGAATGPPLTKKVGSLLSSVGSLDVTNIADGLARFLIKRGKEELNIAFFQRMKEFLDGNIEARTLFPATSIFLGKIAAYRYSELLQSLRESFYKDISNLIVNLNLLIDLPKYQDLLKALPEIRVAIRSAKIISELSQSDSSMHPANLIAHLAALNEWGEMNINLKSSWQVLDRISESVRRLDTVRNIKLDTLKVANDSFVLKTSILSENVSQIDSDKIVKGKSLIVKSAQMQLVSSNDIAWIKFSDFNKDILDDPITLKIYLGLLYQRMDSIVFRDSIDNVMSVQKFMFNNRDNIFRIADLVENFLILANDVEQSIKDIRNKKEKGFTNDDYYTYIEKAIDVIDYGFKVANVVKDGIANDRYIAMARNASDLYKNIYTKNYNAAVMNGYLILEEVLTKSKDAIDSKDSLFRNSAASISPVTITNFNTTKDSIDNSNLFEKDSTNKRLKLVGGILKYGNVMASIVKSESAEDAQAAIEAAVLPAGSSSIKKNTSWNVSLNAYIGGYFGRSVNTTDEIDGNNSKAGVTAPVGIALSKGLGHYKNGSPVGALSFFASLIDVGAIAGFRLNNDSTALEQKVTLNDIFTPGGYLVYGIGLPFKGLSYVPLSIGYGWQYGSKLYNKKDGKLGISDKSRWRSNWFITIDIPLANFWTKNYK